MEEFFEERLEIHVRVEGLLFKFNDKVEVAGFPLFAARHRTELAQPFDTVGFNRFTMLYRH